MSLETDLLLDRRRLKRRLVFWRVFAVAMVLVAALVGLRGAGLTPVSAHIERVSIDGLITDDRKLNQAVEGLADDGRVKAVILSINSPGGSVAGGENLHDAIARVAAKKPVVVTMGGLAASAGYMIAVPASRIFAREATLHRINRCVARNRGSLGPSRQARHQCRSRSVGSAKGRTQFGAAAVA